MGEAERRRVLVEAFVELIGEHVDDVEHGDYCEVLWSGCACGHEHPWEEHYRHVAEVLLASPAMAEHVVQVRAETLRAARVRHVLGSAEEQQRESHGRVFVDPHDLRLALEADDA